MNINFYCLAFAESNVDCKWDRVIFTDESTFNSANDGRVLVYRPQGERYYLQYMSTCKCSGHVCPLLGLDLPRRSWSSPLYRGSPGQPVISAQIAERNGAVCIDALC